MPQYNKDGSGFGMNAPQHYSNEQETCGINTHHSATIDTRAREYKFKYCHAVGASVHWQRFELTTVTIANSRITMAGSVGVNINLQPMPAHTAPSKEALLQH